MPALYSNLLHNLDEFIANDKQLTKAHEPGTVPSSLLSGSLSKALCCILFAACLFIFLMQLTFLMVRVFNLYIIAWDWELLFLLLFLLRELNAKWFWIWISNELWWLRILFDLIWLSDIQRAFRSGPMHPQPRVRLRYWLIMYFLVLCES